MELRRTFGEFACSASGFCDYDGERSEPQEQKYIVWQDTRHNRTTALLNCAGLHSSSRLQSAQLLVCVTNRAASKCARWHQQHLAVSLSATARRLSVCQSTRHTNQMLATPLYHVRFYFKATACIYTQGSSQSTQNPATWLYREKMQHNSACCL